MPARPITENEASFMALIRKYEKAIEDKRLTFAIILGKEGMVDLYHGEELGFFNGPRGVAETRDEHGLPCFHVRFMITDFDGYLHYLLNRAGMAMLPNYKVAFQDGYTIEI